MDRVTKSFLNDFKKSFGFEAIQEQSLLFEHFTNYTLIEPKTEYNFDIESVNIGTDGTIGIDGFSLSINRQLVESKEDLQELLDDNKRSIAEVIFIQTKTSKKFESKEIHNFGFAVSDFIAEVQSLKWSAIAIEKIELFNYFVSRISELKENPSCSLYYVSLGRNEHDQNIKAVSNEIKSKIKSENIFSEVDIQLIDASELQTRYKKIGEAIEKSFDFPRRVTLPVIENVKEAYIGVIDTSTIIKLMTNDNNEILASVFYDNVRDFQGNNKVNAEIAKTLKSDQKDSFAILNNGITVVAESLTTTRDNFTISNYQIINGCQTSHVLFENKTLIDDTVQVPLKLIVTENENLTEQVITATNRQTEVKDQDLIAFSNFQKRLEDFYATFNGEERLYYERRSKQYNNKNVEKKKIIDKTTQIKAVASLYYNKPDRATRFFGTLFKEFGNRLFKDGHEMFPYYVASFTIYKIEQLFKQKKIDSKYKKIKYHLLTMLRHEIKKETCPSFESTKSTKYSREIFSVFKKDSELQALVDKVTEKIDSLDFDLNNNDISKSKDFINRCLEIYR